MIITFRNTAVGSARKQENANMSIVIRGPDEWAKPKETEFESPQKIKISNGWGWSFGGDEIIPRWCQYWWAVAEPAQLLTWISLMINIIIGVN